MQTTSANTGHPGSKSQTSGLNSGIELSNAITHSLLRKIPVHIVMDETEVKDFRN